ncbi:MAG: DUF493 domain-containing protein [bacterium]|jgi:hypothetical protein|nr:DUF493 domain-containing protein [bacterium]
MSWSTSEFKEKLEAEHKFPGKYVFKFIVPVANEKQILDLLPEGELSKRSSKNQNYISLTLVATMSSSDEVIKVYQEAYQIQGIIAL